MARAGLNRSAARQGTSTCTASTLFTCQHRGAYHGRRHTATQQQQQESHTAAAGGRCLTVGRRADAGEPGAHFVAGGVQACVVRRVVQAGRGVARVAAEGRERVVGGKGKNDVRQQVGGMEGQVVQAGAGLKETRREERAGESTLASAGRATQSSSNRQAERRAGGRVFPASWAGLTAHPACPTPCQPGGL